MGGIRSGGGIWERLGVGVGCGRGSEWGWDVGEVRSGGGMWEGLGVGVGFGRG